MIAFLMPQALQRLGKGGPSSIDATIVDEGKVTKVKKSDWKRAAEEFAILREGFPSQFYGLLDPYNKDVDDPDKVKVENIAHWYLLTREVEKIGLVSSAIEGERNLRSEAEYWLTMNPDLKTIDKAFETMMAAPRRAAGAMRLQDSDIYSAYAKLQAVYRLVSTYNTAGIVSDWRMQNLVDQLSHEIDIKLFILSADSFLDDVPEPTEEELQAHFEQYKDVKPGEGEYGLGYRQSDRVKIEYLKIDYTSVLDQINVTGKDARKWYYLNKNNRALIPLAQDQTEPPNYDDIVGDVLQVYKRVKAEEQILEIINFVKSNLVRSTQGLARDGDYRVLPEDWVSTRNSFEELRAEIVERFGADVTYTAMADTWYTSSDMNSFAGIGRATRTVGTKEVRLSDFVESLKEFNHVTYIGLQAGMADQEPLRLMRPFRRIGQSSPEPTDVYFYRVLEADPERPALSLDEVRDEAILNMKKLTVYKKLCEEKENWRTRAATEDFNELAGEYGSIVSPVKRLTRLDINQIRRNYTWEPRFMGPAGRNRDLSDALFNIVKSWDPLVNVDSIDPLERTVVVPIPEKMGLALAVIVANNPLAREMWENSLNSFTYRTLYSSYEQRFDKSSPFSFDNMNLRYKFTYKSDKEDNSSAEEGMGASDSSDEVEKNSTTTPDENGK